MKTSIRPTVLSRSTAVVSTTTYCCRKVVGIPATNGLGVTSRENAAPIAATNGVPLTQPLMRSDLVLLVPSPKQR